MAACLALYLAAGTAAPASAQGAADAPEPASETGVASGGATGFVLADGRYAALPATAPPPRASPLDPEDRPENDDADEGRDGGESGNADESGPDGRAVTVVVPTPAPSPTRPSPTPAEPTPTEPTPAERRTADVPATAPGETRAADVLPPVRERLAESDAEFEACTARLEALGTVFEPVPPLVETKDRDCGIVRPIKVSEIVPGVSLRPDAIMRCDTAQALARWTVDDVLPAAEALGARVTGVDHGSTYICRRRNNRPTGKLSEHAFGNAVDVMGFAFAERDPVRIEPREPGGPVATFQRAVREGSCEHFTTVIGPGTDAAHADHLHLDVKERRGGYRLCE